MDAQNTYLIRRVTRPDLPLIAGWRTQQHIVRWWGAPSLEQESVKLADPRIAMWLAEVSGRPFAFMQDYDVHGWSPHHFDHLPAASRGMDLYIGEPDLLGMGHGSRLLRRHVDNLFRGGVPAVGIDPHPENAAARRAFEKAGFKVASGPVDTQWGRAILMERGNPGHAPLSMP